MLQIWKTEVQERNVFSEVQKSMFESRTLQIFRCVRLACGFRFVTSIFRLDSNMVIWKTENLKKFLQICNKEHFYFSSEKHTGTRHRQVSGLSPCMYLRQKRFVVDLCLYVKRSIVYYCSQYGRPCLLELAASCRRSRFLARRQWRWSRKREIKRRFFLGFIVKSYP